MVPLRLRLIAALLFVLEPLNFAGEALRVVPTLAYRGGIAMLELALHGAVAALVAGAGLALWNGTPDSRRLAAAGVFLWTGRVIQSLYWSVLPNDTVPGSEHVRAAAALAGAAIALMVIRPAFIFRRHRVQRPGPS